MVSHTKIKNGIAICAVIALLSVGACTESNYLIPVGNWTFQGTNYTPTTTLDTGRTLTASTATDSQQISFHFSNPPVAGGSYAIVSPSDTSVGNYVSIKMVLGGGAYHYASTGKTPTPATVSMSFDKLSISVKGSVEMVNTANSSDSAAITYLFVNQQ